MKFSQSLYSKFSKEIKYTALFFSFYQIFTIFVYNFLAKKSFLNLYSNFSSLIDLAIAILVPFWLSKKYLKNNQAYKKNAWRVGFVFGFLIMLFFVFFAIVDIVIKAIFFGHTSVTNNAFGVAISFFSGVFIVLMLGALSGWVAGKS